VGTKFGNIHVRTNNFNELISALSKYSETQVRTKANYSSVLGVDLAPELMELLQNGNQSKSIYYIGEFRKGWFSILNDWFGWGDVESIGRELSIDINGEVVTASYFDDDLFEFNIYKSGQLSAGHIWCEEPTKENYQLEVNKGNIDILIGFFGEENRDKLQSLLSITDCEVAAEEIERLLKIPIWIKSDWLHDMKDKDFANKYKKYDLYK
jgi:hypothetical protein